VTLGPDGQGRPRRALRRLKGWRFHPAALVSLAAAVLSGVVAYKLHVPLAWILGPLVATAAAAIAGLPLIAPLAGRRFGQLTIGASIGLNVSSSVLVTIALWLPVMVATAVFAMFLAAVVSVPFARVGRIDGRTAYYAMMPGGLSEMANIGSATGALAEPIALVQALRVALLVIIIPPLIVSLGIHGIEADGLNSRVLAYEETALALVLGAAGIAVARLCRLNNPWMLGAVLATGAAASTGLIAGRIPYWLFYFGQFMIGLSIGSRFKRESVMRLPRLVITGVAFVIILAAMLFAYAVLLSASTGLDLASTALGASPGGFAEMAVTAQTLHLSVGLITAFHVVRAFFVNGFAEHFRRLLDRYGIFTTVNTMVDKVLRI
jgi:uncharacterized protein